MFVHGRAHGLHAACISCNTAAIVEALDAMQRLSLPLQLQCGRLLSYVCTGSHLLLLCLALKARVVGACLGVLLGPCLCCVLHAWGVLVVWSEAACGHNNLCTLQQGVTCQLLHSIHAAFWCTCQVCSSAWHWLCCLRAAMTHDSNFH